MKPLHFLLLTLCLSCSGADKRIQEAYDKLHEANATAAKVRDIAQTISDGSATEVKPMDSLESVISVSGVREQVIYHTGYTTSYNADRCTPNWVSYALTKAETSGSADRDLSVFVPDPMAKGKSATTYDYSRTGWDRGHMAPAGDMKWSQQAMNESFYLSNICPQAKPLNTGLWRVLEEKARKWAKVHNIIYIVCGPIYDSKPKTIGKNDVAIPTHFFKVLLRPNKTHGYETLGFIFPNEDCDGDIYHYAVSIDEVEQLTGHDFFHQLDDSIEDKVEAKLHITPWK